MIRIYRIERKRDSRPLWLRPPTHPTTKPLNPRKLTLTAFKNASPHILYLEGSPWEKGSPSQGKRLFRLVQQALHHTMRSCRRAQSKSRQMAAVSALFSAAGTTADLKRHLFHRADCREPQPSLGAPRLRRAGSTVLDDPVHNVSYLAPYAYMMAGAPLRRDRVTGTAPRAPFPFDPRDSRLWRRFNKFNPVSLLDSPNRRSAPEGKEVIVGRFG